MGVITGAMSISSQEEITNQASTSSYGVKIQNLDLSCNQPKNNNNNLPTYSDAGGDRVTEENPSFSKSDVLNSIKIKKKTLVENTVYKFFQNKFTHDSSLENIVDFNLNLEEESNLWYLINSKIKNETTNIETEVVSAKNQENTDPEMQTCEKYEYIETSPKQSLEVTESHDSGLCMESDREQNLIPKNHSQEVEESTQQGLSAAEKNKTLEYMIRADKEIREVQNRKRLNADGKNNMDEPTDYPIYSCNSEQSDQVKEKGGDSYQEILPKVNENTIYSNGLKNSHHDSSTALTNICNNTSKTQDRFVVNNESCLSINWDLDGDELTYKMCVNNSAEEDLAEYKSNHYSLEQNGQNYRDVLYPMNDEYGPFFIDRDLVNVSMYQEGLWSKNWNPVQVLYEICNNCNWGPPEFEQVNFSNSYGFLFSIKLKGREFNSQKRGVSKKKAKWFASAFVLQYLGFRFCVENFQDTITSHSLLDTYWNERINAELLKDNSKYEADLFPLNTQKSNSFSKDLEKYCNLRTASNKRKHSPSRGLENISHYNKEKLQHRSREKSENQTSNDTDLDKYKKHLGKKLEESSNHSSPQKPKRICNKCNKIHSHKSKRKSKSKKNHHKKLEESSNKKTTTPENQKTTTPENQKTSPQKPKTKCNKCNKIHSHKSKKKSKNKKNHKAILMTLKSSNDKLEGSSDYFCLYKQKRRN